MILYNLIVFLLLLTVTFSCPYKLVSNHTNFGTITNGNLIIDYCVAEPMMWVTNTTIMINKIYVIDKKWKIRLYNCMSHCVTMYKQIIKDPTFLVYTYDKDESLIKHDYPLYYASVDTMYIVEWRKVGEKAWWTYWIDKKNCEWAWKDCDWYYKIAHRRTKRYLIESGYEETLKHTTDISWMTK